MSSYHGWTHAPKELGGTDPIPSAAYPKEVYAYMDSYNGQVLPADDWWIPEDWEEFMCSPEAGDGSASGLLYPEPGGDAFVMWYDNYDTGTHVHLVEIMCTYFTDVDGDPVAGDWWALGNLVGTSGSLGNFDRHIYQPADMVNTNSFNHSFSTVAIRESWNQLTDRFYATEIGNFCSGKTMFFDTIEMQVVRLAAQPGADADLVYVTP